MKIKKTRQVRLDELIGYITKNELISSVFKSNRGNEIVVDINGDLSFFGRFNYNDLFTITEEVEITEDMVFPIVFVHWSDTYEEYRTAGMQKTPIKDLKKIYDVKFIYLQNEDGSIGDLIWKDGEMID